jgi:K+-transporting ATPase ATPase C chain
MFTAILASIRAIVVLTVITGDAYPLLVTAIAQLAFPTQANGSLVRSGNEVLGSSLLAQKFADPKYFWPRPSAADYSTIPSGASNQGFTSKKLLDAINERRTHFGADAPADLLSASGSVLDPHISPEAARYQVARVAQNRGLPLENVLKTVESSIESPQFGFLGQSRVNVLLLNRTLDNL